jgi:hypothetical protein
VTFGDQKLEELDWWTDGRGYLGDLRGILGGIGLVPLSIVVISISSFFFSVLSSWGVVAG